MKPFVNYLMVIGLLLTVPACTFQREQAHEGQENNVRETFTAETVKMKAADYPEAGMENVERRISENIHSIRARINELNQRIAAQRTELTTSAKLKSKDLKEDLERLQRNLEENRDSLTRTSGEMVSRTSEELQYELEKAEDELAQINEELQEWYEKNLTY